MDHSRSRFIVGFNSGCVASEFLGQKTGEVSYNFSSHKNFNVFGEDSGYKVSDLRAGLAKQKVDRW